MLISAGNLFFDIPGIFEELRLQQKINTSPQLTPPLEAGQKPEITEATKFVDSQTTQTSIASESTPTPTSTPIPLHGYIPDRIIIDSIGLDAPVITAERKTVEVKNQWFEQWSAPDYFAAGWQSNSAPLGVAGNTVINGHHNVFGKVFGKLVNITVGDIIEVRSGSKTFYYQVKEMLILRERDASLEDRIKNAAWIEHTNDERLTLVTCHPKSTNTHRLLIIAFPLADEPTQRLAP